MKGLYRFLSPFASDQSGAAAVLFELGGLVVVCDAGGCAGNICGFDEPRFYLKKAGASAVFSACLRDMDAIMGRDDKLIEKTALALRDFPGAKFIAFVGTPVPSITGTDFKALALMAESNFKKPALAIETNGMETYDKGIVKAYKALLEKFADGAVDSKSRAAGIWGAVPLDLPSAEGAKKARERAREMGYEAVTIGMDSTTDDIKRAGAASVNFALSPSGFAAAKMMREKFGASAKILPPVEINAAGARKKFRRALVVHQQFMAIAAREAIKNFCGQVDVATFFSLEKEFAAQGDKAMGGEDEFIAAAGENQYDLIIADPLLRRAIPNSRAAFVPFPHYAVSAQIHAPKTDREFTAPLEEAFA